MEMNDRDWEAEGDAETLARADAIRKDEQKYNKAQGAAVRLAKEKRDEALSMSKIANQEMFAKSAKAMGLNKTE